MPQLDTIYTLVTYVWTWSVIYTTAQKIKTLKMFYPQMKPSMNKLMKTPSLPWL